MLVFKILLSSRHNNGNDIAAFSDCLYKCECMYVIAFLFRKIKFSIKCSRLESLITKKSEQLSGRLCVCVLREKRI